MNRPHTNMLLLFLSVLPTPFPEIEITCHQCHQLQILSTLLLLFSGSDHDRCMSVLVLLHSGVLIRTNNFQVWDTTLRPPTTSTCHTCTQGNVLRLRVTSGECFVPTDTDNRCRKWTYPDMLYYVAMLPRDTSINECRRVASSGPVTSQCPW